MFLTQKMGHIKDKKDFPLLKGGKKRSLLEISRPIPSEHDEPAEQADQIGSDIFVFLRMKLKQLLSKFLKGQKNPDLCPACCLCTKHPS